MVDRRLGRGLDFFLSGGRQAPPTAPQAPTRPDAVEPAKEPHGDDVLMVELSKLGPSPYQPRKHMDEAELQEVFQPVAEIVSVRVQKDWDTGRTKGFGFVELTSPEEAARVKEEMNGREVNGRQLRVDLSNANPARGGNQRSNNETGGGRYQRGGRN